MNHIETHLTTEICIANVLHHLQSNFLTYFVLNYSMEVDIIKLRANVKEALSKIVYNKFCAKWLSEMFVEI